LIKEYQESDALVFVSTYEGFELPILEAQVIGVPVLTSNIEPMKDVAREGAVLVDTYDAISIRTGLKELLNSLDLSRSLIDSGKSNVERFSAKNVADQYAEIYVEILKCLTRT
jgi:glycosyltransferase involved in cell wall biosynthesis